MSVQNLITQIPQTNTTTENFGITTTYYNVYFRVPNGMKFVNVCIDYLIYSVIYGEVFVSLAKKVISGEQETISKLPAIMVQTIRELSEAIVKAYEQVPSEYKERLKFDKGSRFYLCAPDVMKLNSIYCIVPFTKTRKVMYYEKQIDSFIKEVLEASIDKSSKSLPHVQLVMPDTKTIDEISKAGIVL